MISFFTLAATATATPQANAAAVANSADWMRALIQIVAIIFIFYLFFIRPQQKKAKEQLLMLANLKVGDEVLVGGIIGKIAKLVSAGEVLVEIADGVQIKVLRSYISKVIIEQVEEKSANKNNKK